MLSSEQILENAARDGSIDLEDWPRVLETVLARLKAIVYNDFPLPKIPAPAAVTTFGQEQESLDPEVVASTPPGSGEGKLGGRAKGDESSGMPTGGDAVMRDERPEDEVMTDSQGSSTKENDAPQTQAQTPVRRSTAAPMGVQRDSRSASWQVLEPGTLPPDLLSSYTVSMHMLSTSFQNAPPCTIQRLAELVLHPKRHYRFLPSYLRALDRVVSVSSPASDFPLPALQVGKGGGFLTNGDAGAVNGGAEVGESEGLGSDEALGGALLTPVPWLRKEGATSAHGSNSGGAATSGQSSPSSGDGELRSEGVETIDGPTGPGRIETVSVTVNGITSTAPQAQTAAPTTAQASEPSSPSLSDQSDASTPSHTSTASTASNTEAQLRASGGVTQGELLRQEQEAGVVPVAQSQPRRSLLASGAVAVGRETPSQAMAAARTEGSTANEIAGEGREATDASMADPAAPSVEGMSTASETTNTAETPHARGPGEIDMADTGPQRNHLSPDNAGRTLPPLDMEAAVGRRSLSPNPPLHGAENPQPDTPHPDTAASRLLSQEDVPDNPGPRSSPTAARVARAAPVAEAQAADAAEDDSGKPGRDPEGVRQEVDLLKEGMESMEEEDVKDGDGDVVLADPDGKEAMGGKAGDEGGKLEVGGGNEMRGE